MKNTSKFLVFVAILVFCTINYSAQENEKATGKHGGKATVGMGMGKQNGQVTFCWSSDENTAASYRLKVWQLIQGQSPEAAMRTNQPIVTKDVDNIANPATTAKHAINTKGAGGSDRSSARVSDPEEIRACSESMRSADNPTAKSLKTRTKSNNTNEREASPGTAITTVTSADFPKCSAGSQCDFVWTLEGFDANAKPVDIQFSQQVRYRRFRISPDGSLVLIN